MIKKYNVLFGVVSIILCAQQSFCQQQVAVYDNVSDKVKGFYLYTPQGYPESGVKYPLIIFVHGAGERGPGTPSTLPSVLNNGIPKLIASGTFPKSFTVNSQTFKFIIISPQFNYPGFPSVNDVNDMINYAETKYLVDKNRIYITGLSMGGGVAWYYPGYNIYFSSRIAATVPVCGATEPDDNTANNIANANLPVWATHNNGDGTVPVSNTNELVRKINERPNPPRPLAKKTIFMVEGHDAWTKTYDPTFKEDGKNIYEWMLQYKRNFMVLAVDGLSFNATAIEKATKVSLKWTTNAESNIQGFKILKSNDGQQFTEIGFSATKSVNGAGAQYSFNDENINTGKSFYKLEIVENNGASTFSSVEQITINEIASTTLFPNPAKNKLNLQTSGLYKNGQVMIFNTQGQKLLQTIINGTGKMSIDISKLKPGNYVARIINGTEAENIKFIKQ